MKNMKTNKVRLRNLYKQLERDYWKDKKSVVIKNIKEDFKMEKLLAIKRQDGIKCRSMKCISRVYKEGYEIYSGWQGNKKQIRKNGLMLWGHIIWI